jgi:hypothetical protein
VQQRCEAVTEFLGTVRAAGNPNVARAISSLLKNDLDLGFLPRESNSWRFTISRVDTAILLSRTFAERVARR